MKIQNVKKFAQNFTMLGVMCAAPVVCSAAFTNMNFDTDTAGLPPSGWLSIAQTSAGSTAQVTSAVSESAPNSLELRTQNDFTYGPSLSRILGFNTFGANYISYFSNTLWRFSVRLTDNANQQF